MRLMSEIVSCFENPINFNLVRYIYDSKVKIHICDVVASVDEAGKWSDFEYQVRRYHGGACRCDR